VSSMIDVYYTLSRESGRRTLVYVRSGGLCCVLLIYGGTLVESVYGVR
jgi:hypothetical protein